MALARNDDLTRLWNQAYPEASTAPTNTLAKSQSDVDAMSVRDRLWDSLDYTYGQQRKESDKAFRQANSQLNNAMLQRGMQRSSFGAANNANLAAKQIEAQNDIYSQQIADYEKALLQVEQQDEATRQFNAQLGNNWMNAILAKGGTPSDELLNQIGLSRGDYNAMLQQIDYGGGGGWSEPAKTSRGRSTGGNNTTGNQTGNWNNPPDPYGDAAGYNTGNTSGGGTFTKISGKAIDVGTPVSSGSNYKTSNTSTGSTNSYLGSKKDKVKK